MEGDQVGTSPMGTTTRFGWMKARDLSCAGRDIKIP
jgi:hypothetical protein